MARRRRGIVALGVVAVLGGCVWWLWPHNDYTYQSKPVEEWFAEYTAPNLDYDPFDPVREKRRIKDTFVKMGTNAVPFLIGRINQDFKPTLFERAISKLPSDWRPKLADRCFLEAETSAHLLRDCVKLPDSVLREMLKPALLSTNQIQKQAAERALPRTPVRRPPPKPAPPPKTP